MTDGRRNSRTLAPTKVPGLAKPPAGITPGLQKYLSSLSEAVEIRLGRKGDPRDRAITLRELIESGLAKELANAPFDPNNPGSDLGPVDNDNQPNLAVPPEPTGFSAVGGYSIVILGWNLPPYSNHSLTEIWRHTSDVLGDALLVGVQVGTVYIDPVGESADFYYWIRFVNTDGVPGPFNDNAGSQAATATNTATLIAELEASIPAVAFAAGIEPVGVVNTLPSVSGYTGPTTVLLTTDGKLYRLFNGAWTAAVPTVDLTGTISELQIADDAVTNAKIAVNAIQGDVIAAGAIDGDKITADAITAVKIADDAVTNAAIAVDAIQGDVIAANAITATKITDDAVTSPKILAGAIVAGKIATNAVTANTIQSNAITAAKINAGAVIADKIATNAITAAKIDAGAITAGKIAANAVVASTIASNAVTANKIQANAVIASKIQANAVTADKIQANAITAVKINADAVTANKIATNAVTADAIAAGSITAGAIAAGAINAQNIIADGMIIGDKIAGETITAANILVGTIGADRLAAGSVTADKVDTNTIITYAANIQDAVITAAKIGNAEITTAKIYDAAVETLKIANEAVTIPDGDNAIVSEDCVNAFKNVDAGYLYLSDWGSNDVPSALLVAGQVTYVGTNTSNQSSGPATAYIRFAFDWKSNTGAWLNAEVQVDSASWDNTIGVVSLRQGYGGAAVTTVKIDVPTWSRGFRIRIQGRNEAASGTTSRKASRYGFFIMAAKR